MTKGSRRALRPGRAAVCSGRPGAGRVAGVGGSGEDQPGPTEQEAEPEQGDHPQIRGRPLRTARGRGDG